MAFVALIFSNSTTHLIVVDNILYQTLLKSTKAVEYIDKSSLMYQSRALTTLILKLLRIP
jgi:hypothetical protein